MSAHRGDGWEAILDTRHALYEAQRRAVCVRLYPPHRQVRRLAGAQAVVVFVGAGPVDYVVASGGVTYYLDAKDTQLGRFPLGGLSEHQARFLDSVSWQSPTNVGGLLLRLGEGTPRQWFVPWAALAPVWHRWASSENTMRGEGSVNLEWLAQHAVPMRDGSDWLGAVERADMRVSA